MTDREHRLRVRIDVLADENHELKTKLENALVANAKLRLLVEELQAQRKAVKAIQNVTVKPCTGCGCHPDVYTLGCRRCAWRHSARRRRFNELVTP